MKLRLASQLGSELHHLFEAQAACPPTDPAKPAGEKALLALRPTKTTGNEWTFESDDATAIKTLTEHLRWIADTADSLHPNVCAAARRTLARIEKGRFV